MDSYKESIFEPLEYYCDHGKAAHAQNIKEHFDALVEKSGINIEENKETVKKYREKEAHIGALEKKLKKYKLIRIFGIALAIIAFVLLFAILSQTLYDSAPFLAFIIASLSGLIVVLAAFAITKSEIALLNKKIANERKLLQTIKQTGEIETAPLCALFSDNDTLNLIEKTLPQLKFHSLFLFENLEDLKNNYGFNALAGEKSTVLDTLSGRLYKNPFLFERCKNEAISSQTYTGMLVITWYEYRHGNGGKCVRKTRHQTLVATVTKPKPIYNVTTLLSYGSQAAPDLCFARENRHFEDLSEKQVERTVKKGEKNLKKKSEEAITKGSGFTEMSNTKFDVLFDATNRDNEQQFRLMFTPLAQREMLDLIRSEEGYGDDFDFFKRKKISVIRSEHSQNWNMNTSASGYYSFDFEEIKRKFESINTEYFKSIYFDFAPLIAIPAYQDPPSKTFEENSDAQISYTEYNYEAIANKIGPMKFAHPSTATDVILKTDFISRQNGYDTIAVTAYSYAANKKTDYIPTLGGDGNIHMVPVPWIDYAPLQKTSLVTLKSIGMTENEYYAKLKKLSGIQEPQDAVCYKGVFAFIGASGNSVEEFIKNITNKGEDENGK